MRYLSFLDNHVVFGPDDDPAFVSFDISLLRFEIRQFGTTFGHFWNWLTASPESNKVLSQLYAKELRGPWLQGSPDILEHYVERSKQPCDRSIDPEGLTELRVMWKDLRDPAMLANGADPMKLTPVIAGWGRFTSMQVADHPQTALERYQFNELMHYPMKLHTLTEGKWDRIFELQDVVGAVFSEVRYFGLLPRWTEV